jgi:hypothetical protein
MSGGTPLLIGAIFAFNQQVNEALDQAEIKVSEG